MSKSSLFLTIVGVIVVVAGAILYFNNPKTVTAPEQNNMNHTLMLSSSAFKDGAMIPAKYTCDGANLVPPLSISGVPKNTKSLALILDDPDAPIGTFTHWVKWNIPAKTTEILEGVEPEGDSGKGSSGDLTYVGPCPPTGTHHYHFQLYALDRTLSLPAGSTKQALEDAMEGHIMDQTELVGIYQK